MQPELSIIIVNYKSVQLILDCLQSVYKYNNTATFEILIVDNSNDDPKMILEHFPGVRWIPMEYNAGFARANNKGIQMASAENLLLLNPDILAEGNDIEQCLAQFRMSPYVACGVQLLNPDKTPQISGSYFMKGGLNILLPLPFLGRFFKWLGNLAKVEKPSIMDVKGLMEVDWINGAFLMVKKNVTQTAGLLDEDFFLYSEEIEWCSRLRKKGKLCVYGDLHVIHLQGEAANEAFDSEGKGYHGIFDKKGRQIMISSFVRIRKQYGVDWFLFHLLAYLCEIPVFFFGIILQPIFNPKRKFKFSHFSGYCGNVFYLMGKSMKIMKNKPYFYKAL